MSKKVTFLLLTFLEKCQTFFFFTNMSNDINNTFGHNKFSDKCLQMGQNSVSMFPKSKLHLHFNSPIHKVFVGTKTFAAARTLAKTCFVRIKKYL